MFADKLHAMQLPPGLLARLHYPYHGAGGVVTTLLSVVTGKLAANGQEQMGQVQISTAFNSPDLLQNCLVFLRQYASDMGAHAACAIVPKQDIAYPQVLLPSVCKAAETWPQHALITSSTLTQWLPNKAV